MSPSAYLAHHSLVVRNLDVSVRFYSEQLQMVRLTRAGDGNVGEAWLAFERPGSSSLTALHLIEGNLTRTRSNVPKDVERDAPYGYWKFSVTMPNVDFAAASLRAAGVTVSEPKQFRDIGYLCHLADPDGHAIELLQHTFGAKPAERASPRIDGGFGLITLRVSDIAASLKFYQEVVGMKLLSVQAVEPFGFTLYFLAFTDQEPPDPDLAAVENRPWLWQQPFTSLELQHRWGADPPIKKYRVDGSDGFDSFTIASNALARAHPTGLLDPEGYTLRFLVKERLHLKRR